MADHEPFAGIAQEQTLQATLALQSEIKALNDTMLYFVSAILEKMPRLDATDRAVVTVENGNIVISGSLTALTTLSTLTNLNNLNNFAGGNAANVPNNLSEAALVRLYDNIKVT